MRKDFKESKPKHLITAKKAYQLIGCDSRHFDRVYKKHLIQYFEKGGKAPRYDYEAVVKVNRKYPYAKALKQAV